MAWPNISALLCMLRLRWVAVWPMAKMAEWYTISKKSPESNFQKKLISINKKSQCCTHKINLKKFGIKVFFKIVFFLRGISHSVSSFSMKKNRATFLKV